MPRTFIRSYPVTCLTIAAECNMFSTLFQMYHQIPSMFAACGFCEDIADIVAVWSQKENAALAASFAVPFAVTLFLSKESSRRKGS